MVMEREGEICDDASATVFGPNNHSWTLSPSTVSNNRILKQKYYSEFISTCVPTREPNYTWL